MKIIFLRHGLTDSNKDKRFSTKNTEISNEAYKKLDISKKYLEDYNFEEIYTSDLLRSQQTAKYLGFNDFKIDKRLNEMDFGDFKGQRLVDTYKNFKEFYENKSRMPFETRYPNGESIIDLIDRVNNFIEEKIKEDKNILCISHGIAIKASLFTILKDLSNFDNFWIENASLSVININKNKKIIECINKI